MTNRHIEKAAQLAPIIERVHGEHHPELTRVRQIAEELQRSDDATNTITLFQELRTVTENYAIPNDVCEAFEATYRALERADKHLTAA
jgi:regulator of cell morphogenesis and NO signaling